MRLIPGTQVTVKLDEEAYRFVLVTAGGNGNGRLNIKAPLAVLLGSMGPGSVSKAWTPLVTGATPMRVELMEVIYDG